MAGREPSRSSSQPSDEGFFSRWSQRKQLQREGKPLEEPALPVKTQDTQDLKRNQGVGQANSALNATNSVASEAKPVEASQPAPAPPPAPTLEDTRSLTPQSDFKPFMRADVSPEVKNAAMKQLFKDPHFNVMDMMDVYVDDYSKPDPLPPEMLRKMAVTKFLGFWEEEEKEAAEKKAREDANTPAGQNVAQSEPANTEHNLNPPEQGAAEQTAAHTQRLPDSHDHPDLQLQPDDAAGRETALRGAG